GWNDLFNLRVIYPEKESIHNRCVKKMFDRMDTTFPEHKIIWSNGKLNLKMLPDGRRFSPPIVFLGIFHGLHIAHLFKNTVFTDALFLEPDPDRFEVSCYFLDYSEIVERLGQFHIYVGEEALGRHFARFFFDYSVTPHMWVRVLPGYVSSKMPMFIEVLKALQSTRSDTVFSHDDHIQGLRNACSNISRNLPILTKRPKLEKRSVIAVVASGPSLDHDLQWLKRNQDKMIIFAVHSSVRTLKQHGIKVDLQFSLDTLLNEETVRKLELYTNVPLVNSYKVGGAVTKAIEKLLLVGDKNASDAVKLVCPLQYTTPSSTNLAFSFACFCHPKEIYLLGCDMAFRSFEESHVSGHHNKNADKSEDIYQLARQMLTAPNFTENEPFQTTSFLNSTKMAIEAVISENRKSIKVYNLSDGARISGAIPRRSGDVKLSQYSRKEQDVQKMIISFTPMKKHTNWQNYPISGEKIFEHLKGDFLSNIKIEEFDWFEFSKRVNSALFKAMISCGQEMGKDYRMAIYNKVLLDLLCAWYIFVIFRDEYEDAARVCMVGYNNIKTIIEELVWPKDVTPEQ
ncbi:MAG TPA: hypothetical protein DEG92_08130, partial [Rikenellaceae bacterium]|nr:hypothetical protein [Rikenellaceae bacterium]